MKPGKSEIDPPVSNSGSEFTCLGVISLLSYNFFVQCLGVFVLLFGNRYASDSHIIYGLSATVGQILCILVRRKISPRTLISVALFAISMIAFLCGFLAVVEVFHARLVGLSIASMMGLFISVLQSSSSAIASNISSSELLTAFFMGQSISGFIPWPVTAWYYALFKYVAPLRKDEFIAAASMLTGGIATFAFAVLFLNHSLPSGQSKQSSPDSPSVWSAFVSEWQIITLCWFTFVVSFTLYPRDLLNWSPSCDIDTSLYRSILIYIAIIGDVCGMYLAAFITVSPQSTQIFGYMRAVFIPLFSLISQIPISSSVVQIISILLMSISGGFILASAMSQIQSNNQTVGYLVSISLTIGIMVGSTIGSIIDML